MNLKKKRILFLDDMEVRVPKLFIDEEVYYVRNFEEFCQWLEQNGTPDVISYDHDLAWEHYIFTEPNPSQETPYETYGEKTGVDCAAWAIEHGYVPRKVIVHSWNVSGSRNIANLFRGLGCTLSVRPFNPKSPHTIA